LSTTNKRKAIHAFGDVGEGRLAKRSVPAKVNYLLGKRLVFSSAHLSPKAFMKIVSVFVLPTELLLNIAGLCSDEDLYTLTCINHELADITCSLYVARRVLDLDATSVCVKGSAFKVLPVWYRSLEFTPKRLISCRFSDDQEQAVFQIRQFQAFFSIGLAAAQFKTVQLIGVDIMSPSKLLSLLELIDHAGCRRVVVSARRVNWRRDIEMHSLRLAPANQLMDAPQCQLPRLPVHFSALEHLNINYRFFSAAQWAAFLERLHISSLQSLHIHGESSISTLKKFLLQHLSISFLEIQPRPSIFDRRTPPCRALRGRLQLQELQELRGSLYHILSLLQSLLHPPQSLRQLNIFAEDLPYNVFVDKVKQCLALCEGPLCLSLDYGIYGHVFRTLLTPHPTLKLRSKIQLAPVVKLEITFNTLSDELVMVCILYAVDLLGY
jgi:hypothetical protein